jgi:hypothetical protein
MVWLAVWWTLLLLSPLAGREFGDIVGYGLFLFTVALGSWRLNRWCSDQYSRGLRDHQS